jgi:DNA primase
MIKPNSVEEILNTAKIEEVVGEFVQLKRRGVNLIGRCPFHNEKTPSFTVSPSKNIYKCFGCGKGGNSTQFLMEHEQMSFPEALRYLANKYNIEIEETIISQESIEERQLLDSLYIINEYAKNFYHDQLMHTDIGKSVGLRYFKDRGFRTETIEKFGLGFAPNEDRALTDKATQAGHNQEMMKKLGLTTQYGKDFFRNRVMFTIHNLSGKVIGFGGRILQKDVKAPKYINSPETEVYNKSRVLYGAFFAKKAIRQLNECIMVEGYTDVISLHQEGIENVVASSGTSLTIEQIQLVKRNTDNMKILYDGDAAGVKAALRGLELVLEQDMNVKVVLLPDGHDPDSYLQEVGAEAFKQFISEQAKDFILFKASLLMAEAAGDPVKKTAMIKDIMSSVARIPDVIKRALYTKECAALVQVEEEILYNELNKILKQQSKQEQQKRERASSDSSFPSVEPNIAPGDNQDGEYYSQEILEKKARPISEGISFQERDIIRLLISSGGELFDKDQGLTVAGYILNNIEEVLDDFDNKLYERVARECLQLLMDKREINYRHFIEHWDEDISQLAISILTSPNEYSPNWKDKHGIDLRTQPMPEKNFTRDSIYALNIFKLKKIDSTLAANQERIKTAQAADDMELMMKYLKVQTKLLSIRSELAKLTNTVILK